MNAAILVPVKAFTQAKQRLTATLSPHERRRLARWLADGVLDAVSDSPVFVVCDDEEVRDWAVGRGATALWTAQLGLNGAVDDGVQSIADAGYDHVTVTHSDLPLPAGLTSVARRDTVVLVPDTLCDGTNVMSFPLARAIKASYGSRSFTRHRDIAVHMGLAFEVRIDAELAIDLDTPSDLTHPLLREVLPSWLPTIPVNHFIQP